MINQMFKAGIYGTGSETMLCTISFSVLYCSNSFLLESIFKYSFPMCLSTLALKKSHDLKECEGSLTMDFDLTLLSIII